MLQSLYGFASIERQRNVSGEIAGPADWVKHEKNPSADLDELWGLLTKSTREVPFSNSRQREHKEIAGRIPILSHYIAGFSWGTQLEIGEFRSSELRMESINGRMMIMGDVKWQAVVRQTCVMPYWFLALLTAFLLGCMGWRLSRQIWNKWRYPPNHCRTCGYNLTGNISGVCPECGTSIESRSPISA